MATPTPPTPDPHESAQPSPPADPEVWELAEQTLPAPAEPHPPSGVSRASAAASRLRSTLTERARPGVEAARAAVDRVAAAPETKRLVAGAGRVAQGARIQAEAAARVAATHAASAGRQAQAQAKVAAGQAKVAAPQARTPAKVAARSGVSGLVAFPTGCGYFWAAVGRFLRSSMLWLITIVPIGLAVVFLASIEVVSIIGASAIVHWIGSFTENWPGVLHGAIRVTVEFLLHRVADMTAAFLALPASLLISQLHNGRRDVSNQERRRRTNQMSTPPRAPAATRVQVRGARVASRT